jgi:hypothetical protein
MHAHDHRLGATLAVPGTASVTSPISVRTVFTLDPLREFSTIRPIRSCLS